jgi:uncharacterized membrane protein
MRKTIFFGVVITILLALCACKPAAAPASGKGDAISEAQNPSAGPALPEIGQALADTASSPFQGEFEAVGEEPYWTLDVLKDWVSFARLNLPGVGALPSTRRYGALGMTLDAGPLSVALTAGPCKTSAGDAHEFNAAVRHDGVLYQGCARRLTGERVSAGWASNLPELMPAITSCLGRVKAGPAQITIAYQDTEGEISVRLLESDGGRYECITRKAGAEIRYFDVIGDQDTLDGERDPLFTPAPGLPRTGPCFVTEPAPDGLGSLTRRVC